MTHVFVLTLLCASPKVSSILDELERLDRHISTAETELRKLAEREGTLREERSNLEAELADTRVKQAQSAEHFRKRTRALARLPSGARVLLLGSSESLARFLDTQRMLRWVAQHDKKLYATYRERSTQLETLSTRLERQQQEQREIIEQVKKRRDQATAQRREKADFLQRLSRDQKRRDLMAREKAAARRTLRNMVGKLKPKGTPKRQFALNRGRLPWPANGKISAAFGAQVERAYGTIVAHNGWDIRARSGDPVQAIAPGRVVYANWLKGYGQLVIIDHGHSYHSLVAHLAEMRVETGKSVEQGETLGVVGDTGSTRGTVLYFELRHQGIPVDPVSWLRK